ncbi:MAG TPA: RNA polymerase sporulation sigma factor SigH [Gemmatimonadales bacterium]|nr:RNA polymerase sporulation sigma factor SigH [Gemmatimonadales bacterium]
MASGGRTGSGRGLADLSDEEVLARARAGDRFAVEHLLARYRGMVESKARLYFLSGADHEDVVQEGMIGLYKAIRDYQANRLVRFRAFAEMCVTRQIISAIKTATRQKHLPLNHYVPLTGSGFEGEVWLAELLPDARPEEADDDPLRRRLWEYLERYGPKELSALENQVIRCRLEGKSYQQVAAELKCRPKCVDNALQRAKKKIWSRITSWQD